MSEDSYRKDRETIYVHGHVYDRLDDYQKEDETFSEAIERLLPWKGEVIEWAEADAKYVSVETEVYRELKASSGQSVSMGDVIDQYLTENGHPRKEDKVRRNELDKVDN